MKTDIQLDRSQAEHSPDTLKELIRVLQIADKHSFGLSSLSSPIDLLIDVIVDLILIMRQHLIDGAAFRKNNPGIKFLDRFQDVLGNPKQISFRKKERLLWDPEAKEWILALASTLVQVKTGIRFKDAFMASFEYLISDDFANLQKTKEIGKNLRNKNMKFQRAGRHWYRRQQIRKQKNQ